MTISWSPNLEGRAGLLYQAIVEALAEDISAGRLAPQFRLPTHRELAEELGVAVGTVTRAYAEAEKKGLIRGEGRRGTLVGESPVDKSSLSKLLESESLVIDLSKNYPSGSEDPDLTSVLKHLARQPDTQQLLRYPSPFGYHRGQVAGAKWVASMGMKVEPDTVLISNGAQHGLIVVFAAICEPGDTVLAAQNTYPGMKAIADILRLRLAGVPCDSEGPLPDALEAICKKRKVRALYCNPTLHNPTNFTVSNTRRKEIAKAAEKFNVTIVEDEILRRLLPDPPVLISKLAPDRSCLVASVSKVIAGGLRVGFIVAPPRIRQRLASYLWTTTLVTSPIPVEILATWIDNGISDKIVINRRRETRARQKLASEILTGQSMKTDPMSYHIWLNLPDYWTTTDFAMEAHRRGVAVAPAELFAVDESKADNAIRICLGAIENRMLLRAGLETLTEILQHPPRHGPKTI